MKLENYNAMLSRPTITLVKGVHGDVGRSGATITLKLHFKEEGVAANTENGNYVNYGLYCTNPGDFGEQGREVRLARIEFRQYRFFTRLVQFESSELQDGNLQESVMRFIETNTELLAEDARKKMRGVGLAEDIDDSKVKSIVHEMKVVFVHGEMVWPDELKVIGEPVQKEDPSGLFHPFRVPERDLYHLQAFPGRSCPRHDENPVEVEKGGSITVSIKIIGMGCELLGYFDAGEVKMTYKGGSFEPGELERPENWSCNFVANREFMQKNEKKVPGFEKRFQQWLSDNSNRLMFRAGVHLRSLKDGRKVNVAVALYQPYIVAEM